MNGLPGVKDRRARGRIVIMPRIFGHDLIAFIAAIVAFYAVGFIIYALVFSEFWMNALGYSEADFAGQEWKMILGPVMPVLIVLGLAKICHKTGADDLTGRLKLGAGLWLFFMVPVMMYDFVYGTRYPLEVWLLDSAHLLVATLLASAVLTWRKSKPAAT